MKNGQKILSLFVIIILAFSVTSCVCSEATAEDTIEIDISKLTVVAVQGSDQTDESYANFREIIMGDIPEGVLYRSSSPLLGIMEPLGGPEGAIRADVAESLMEKAGINAVFNMAYTDEELKDALSEKGSSSYYKKLFDEGKVYSERLPYSYSDEAFQKGLLDGTIFLLNNEPPYLFHCHGGIDRTGFLAIILEMLMGADKDEIIADYVESWVSLYGIDREGAVYTKIWNERGVSKIKSIINEYGNYSGEADNLREVAKNYLFGIGMSADSLEKLITRLQGN